MATDDAGTDDLSGGPVLQDDEQPQDALPGQPIARAYRLICCLMCGIAGAGLGIAQVEGHNLNFGLALLGLLLSGVPILLVFDGLNDKQLGAVRRGIGWAAVIFGVIGVLTGGAAYGAYGG